MGEFRKDLLSDRWVLIAEHRAARPDEFRSASTRRIVAPCPFCRGNESHTPPAVAIYGDGVATDVTDWQVRVVPNKYPAVSADPVSHPEDGSPQETTWRRAAHGRHEVIIESPRHVVSLSDLTDDQAEWTFRAYQERMRNCQAETELAYALVFKNARSDGGASLEHTHSQLIATPMVPAEVAIELAGADRWSREAGQCPFCQMIRAELSLRERIVARSDRLVAICPFASRFPYETWILPRAHHDRFEEDPEPSEVAHLMRDVVRRMEAVLPETAYNYWIHTAPCRAEYPSSYHWHIEVVTRMSRLAGFELGAGYFINPIAPERAAQQLRSAICSPFSPT